MREQPDRLGIAVVGSGRMGRLRAHLAAGNPLVDFLAVTDADVAQALAAYRAKRAQQLLDNPDPSAAG